MNGYNRPTRAKTTPVPWLIGFARMVDNTAGHKTILVKQVMRFSLSLAMLLICTIAQAQPKDDPKYSADAEKAAKARQEAISNELKSLGDHEWAGGYFFGDGLGTNVSFAISPQSGYVFEWHGCMGLYDRNYGSITQEGDHLRLQFTFANNRKGFQAISSEFLPVRWGARHYLIPADGVVGFCNAVNAGSEPREDIHGRFLLRRGDEKKPVKGFPSMPRQYEAYLLAKPVNAEIVAVGKYTTRPSIVDFKFKDTLVTLNKGTNDGLRVGMELHVTDPKDVVESATIVKEGPDESEAVMTQMGEKEPGPKVGWRFSTRARWWTSNAESQRK